MSISRCLNQLWNKQIQKSREKYDIVIDRCYFDNCNTGIFANNPYLSLKVSNPIFRNTPRPIIVPHIRRIYIENPLIYR